MVRAVIDVGSNSVLLLVARKEGTTWIPLCETSEVTALGENTKSTGFLKDTSIERTLGAVRRAFDLARSHDADRCVAAATMAARIAKNAQEFQERAAAQGTPVSVLPGDEEARLGFLAVADDPTFARDSAISIIDPGGNSTELVVAQRYADGWREQFRQSFPIGTLGLRDTSLHTESPTPGERLMATVEIDRMLPEHFSAGDGGRCVVLGATGTNLVTIRERMLTWQPDRVHGASLEYEEVSRAAGWMFGMTDAERAAIPGIEPGREKTLHIGALILERFLYCLKSEACTVSVRGWRHALLERLDDVPA